MFQGALDKEFIVLQAACFLEHITSRFVQQTLTEARSMALQQTRHASSPASAVFKRFQMLQVMNFDLQQLHFAASIFWAY